MKQKLKINFVDFWPSLVKTDNYFFHLLNTEYDVEIDGREPDILFHSVDYFNRKEHLRYDNGKTIKVFYTGENRRVNFDHSHFAFSFDYSENERNYRLPLWAFHLNWFNVPHCDERDQSYLHPIDAFLEKKIDKDLIRKEKKEFCAFIASHGKGKRLEFVPKLHHRKPVACGGKLYNNIGGQIEGRGDQKWKIDFLNQFKFNISFENSSTPGYVTEKIIQPMFSNTIPIYWGSERVNEEFNEKSFINAHSFSNDEDLIEEILSVYDNEDKYFNMLGQPWLPNGVFPEYIKPKSVLSFFKEQVLKSS